jgi:hypothetical protein
MTTYHDIDLPEMNLDNLDGHRRGRPSERKRTGSAPRYNRVDLDGFSGPLTFGLGVLLLVAGMGDFVSAHSVFDQVFTTSSSLTSLLLAISITVLAIVATHVAGYMVREAHSRKWLLVGAGAVLGAWLAMGLLLGGLRIAVGSPSGSSAQAGNPFAGVNFGSPAPHAWAVAAVLGAVWIVTGVTSFAIGFLAHAPAGAALRRLACGLKKLSDGLAVALKAERDAAHTLAAHRLHKARLPEMYRQAEAKAAAYHDELRQWSRIELVRVLGDPAATTDIFPRPQTPAGPPTANDTKE